MAIGLTKYFSLALILLPIITACSKSLSPSEQERADLMAATEVDRQKMRHGRVECKRIIEQISRNPSQVQIGDHNLSRLDAVEVAPVRQGHIAMFDWTGPYAVRMPNAFGGLNRTDIFCEYDIRAMKIVTFNIDSEDLLSAVSE